MEIQARSTCCSDGTDIIDGLPSDTLGALIIGCDFNSHLSRGMRSNAVQVELMVSPHRLRAEDGYWKSDSGKTRFAFVDFQLSAFLRGTW